MTHDEFVVGGTFWTHRGEWRCTDKGARTIVAVFMETDVISWHKGEESRRHVTFKEDPSWWNGPPYAVAEVAFDEYDMQGCSLSPAEL